MHGTYAGAIETRLGWLRWCDSGEAQRLWGGAGLSLTPTRTVLVRDDPVTTHTVLGMARHVLEHGPTYYMDPRFCHLVDHARESVPEDLVFDPDWLLSPSGWMWMGEPVRVPELMDTDRLITPGYTVVRALGWRHLPPGTQVIGGSRDQGLVSGSVYEIPAAGATHFCFFIAFEDYRRAATGGQPALVDSATAEGGFGVWSYFMVEPGFNLGERVEKFEREMRKTDVTGRYVEEAGRRTHRLHEMRWLYTALKLMSQRLATRVRVPTSRAVRRRAERYHQEAPPFVEVIVLRRLQHYAIRTGQAAQKEVIDWRWSWIVRGHWRMQWYPSKGTHQPKFIEAYVKGPDDKPLKPKGADLFVARR